ncbi:MAG: histidine kinase [Flavobacteriales bacterium]|nr:histidine kinase [Flavobacteriales bacterium]
MVWGVLFALPYFIAIGNDRMMDSFLKRSWTPLVFYAVLFYSNYLYLLDEFLFRKKTYLYILINAGLILLAIFLDEQLKPYSFSNEMPMRPMGDGDGPRPPFRMFILLDVIRFGVPVLVSVAAKTTSRWMKLETERMDTENSKLQSDLQNLRYQIQPHFFFNSLNNIYSLVDISPEDAKKTIHTLGKLMRYLLYDTDTETVGLNQEIDFLTKYVELMKLRSSEKTTIQYTFPTGHHDVQIAPLLFISLVENAFKHGVSANQPSLISFVMKVDNDQLVFTSINSNFPKETSDKSGSGIGLHNLRQRLQLLYPNRNELNTKQEQDTFMATLKINLV